MYCRSCGKEVSDIAYICVHCGSNLQEARRANNPRDTGSIGWFWLGFFVPLAGLFLWIFTYESSPRNAKRAGIGAIVGAIAAVVAIILFYIILFLLIVQGNRLI